MLHVKSHDVAEQMTLLDAELFQKIEVSVIWFSIFLKKNVLLLSIFVLLHYKINQYFLNFVMVRMLTLSGVDCKFEPWSGRTKNYKIGIYIFSP